MPDMRIDITVQYVGDPEPDSHGGTDVSDAQAFVSGLTGDFQSVQASMSCTTTGGEARLLQRGAVDEGCEALLSDIEDWLSENAAYE
jgi:hypothetical protein